MKKRKLEKKLEHFPSFVKKVLGREPTKEALIKEAEIFSSCLPDSRFYASERAYRHDMIRYHNSQVARFKTLYSRKANSLLVEQLKKMALVRPDSRVVSLGSGLGVLEAFIARNLCPRGQVVGVDFSHALNLESKKIADKFMVSNLKFVEADIYHLPLASESQDLVVVAGPYHFKKTVYEESHRVLKGQSSRLIFSSMNFPEFVEPTKRMILESGFAQEFQKTWDIPDYPLILISFKKK